MTEYDQWEGVRVSDADAGEIGISVDGREISILGSQDGLTSLAIRLLSLAQGETLGHDQIRLISYTDASDEPLEVTFRKK